MSARSKKRTMRQTWQRIRTVPGLGRDVAALVGLVVLGIAGAAYVVSNVNVILPWSSHYVLKAEVRNAFAASPDNQQEVRIAGVKVGQLTDVTPTDHNTAILTMDIDTGNKIYSNARVIWRPVNPLNQMYITLNPGAPPARQLPSESTLPLGQTAVPVQPDEVLDKLDTKSRVALTSLLEQSDAALANAPQTLPVALQAGDDSLNTLRPVVARLAKRHDDIAKLITGFSQLTAALGGNDARLTSLVNATQSTLGVLAARNSQLGQTLQELPGTTDSLKHALGSTSDLSHELNPVLDNVKAADKDLPDALDELKDAAGPLRDTADAARSVVSKGRGFVDDLGDSVGPLHDSFDDLKPITACLDEYTAKIAPWMDDFAAFTYGSNSAFNSRDTNGTFPQGAPTVIPTNPLGAMHQYGAGEANTNKYQDAPSQTGLPYPAVGSGECK
jgi:phospholipid/cholesterol/gamma-HCH transport system substrate-binding protein